jgi:flagellar hook-basal body complex protein FliE
MINNIQTIQPLKQMFDTPKTEQQFEIGQPTFLDVFKGIAAQANETQAIKTQDMLDIMLGEVDDLERVQANITKAQIAMELLTTTRNAVLESYNEIIKMGI